MKFRKNKSWIITGLILAVGMTAGGCGVMASEKKDVETTLTESTAEETTDGFVEVEIDGMTLETTEEETMEAVMQEEFLAEERISWDENWEFAEFSMIHESDVVLYRSSADAKVIAINAGHGTSGGSNEQTLCHPDGSAKVTGGSTSEGATYATAISGGTTMLDGTAESVVTLKLAKIVKEKLLENGFNVLMIREEEDTRLDNIARTVFANENADCHLALHYDSTENDKGFFYIGVPDVSSYRSMEPVASHWTEHEALGQSLLEGMKEAEVKIFGEGNLPLDLTQTSYSKIPSVDVEVGDRGSDYSDATLEKLADGIVKGLKEYFLGNVL